MSSLTSNNKQSLENIFCIVRKKFIPKTKEECVRQKLLHTLISDLGFPISGIMVEKKISELPHLLSVQKIPNRRIDVICYGQNPHTKEYLPLLLAECKACAFTQKAKTQMFGYNYFIRAKVLALVNHKKEDVYVDTKSLNVSFIPKYDEILQF